MSELANALVELHEAAEHEEPRFLIECMECFWYDESPTLPWACCDSCGSPNLAVTDRIYRARMVAV